MMRASESLAAVSATPPQHPPLIDLATSSPGSASTGTDSPVTWMNQGGAPGTNDVGQASPV